MILPEFPDQDAHGVVRIRGHRLRLIDLAARFEDGCSAEGICEYYDTLKLPLVYKVIGFYLENEEEVSKLIEADREAFQQLDTPRRPTLVELRERVKARNHAATK
jgi:uncharacterized protein (DUF433 family)